MNPLSRSKRLFILAAAVLLSLFAVLLIGPIPAQEKADFTRWEKAIAAFEQQDREKPQPKDAILFVGSSSIRLWNLSKSFPGLDVINRGFGGSYLADTVHFAPRIVLKYQPRLIVVYAGDNDLATGKSPEQVAADFEALAKLVHKELPKARIVYLSIKPSVQRWKLWDKIQKTNALIEAICKPDERLTYLDVGKPLLGEDGKPRPELFIKDGLHLNEKGYEQWTALLKGSGLLTEKEKKPEPMKPSDVLRLFNGKDLTGLSTWLKDTKRDDPRKVFRVEDGLLHISGEGFGYVATDKEYRDYRVIVEYKWGKKTDGGKYVRNSGVLLHATGPDGGANGTWMSSIECQLAQGCVGDLIVIRGKDDKGETIPVQLTSDVVLGPDKRPRWKQGGEPRVFTKGQLWWSQHDPDFKELLDTRGKNDVESQIGEWTRVECLCDGGRITVRVNGTTVNQAYEVSPAAGKILLQSEGFELFVRTFELHPLQK